MHAVGEFGHALPCASGAVAHEGVEEFFVHRWLSASSAASLCCLCGAKVWVDGLAAALLNWLGGFLDLCYCGGLCWCGTLSAGDFGRRAHAVLLD